MRIFQNVRSDAAVPTTTASSAFEHKILQTRLPDPGLCRPETKPPPVRTETPVFSCSFLRHFEFLRASRTGVVDILRQFSCARPTRRDRSGERLPSFHQSVKSTLCLLTPAGWRRFIEVEAWGHDRPWPSKLPRPGSDHFNPRCRTRHHNLFRDPAGC